MKVSISKNIFEAINIYSLISPEMKDYSRLSLEKEDEVLRSTFLRIFNTLWGINAPRTFVKVDKAFRLERAEERQKPETKYVAREVATAFSSTLNLFGFPKPETKIVRVETPKPVKGEENKPAEPEVKPVPKNDLIIRTNKNGNQVEFYLQATYSDYYFNIVCVGNDADDPKDVEYFEAELMENIDNVLSLTVKVAPKYFMKHFFNELHHQKLSLADGDDINKMMIIYSAAMEIYPDFAKASIKDRVEIMEKGLKKAFRSARANRDIYMLAKCSFEALHDAKMINTVKLSGRKYSKIEGHYCTRRNPDKPSEIWERHCLMFVEYEYTANDCKFRTSFSAYDLWIALTGRWNDGEGKETA